MNDSPRTAAPPSEEKAPRRASAQAAYAVPPRRRLGRAPRTPKADDRLAEFLENLLADTPPGAYARISRDAAAKALGITSWQAKTLYGEAVALGLIEPRGKRTWRV